MSDDPTAIMRQLQRLLTIADMNLQTAGVDRAEYREAKQKQLHANALLAKERAQAWQDAQPKWSDKAPTEPGWYWARDRQGVIRSVDVSFGEDPEHTVWETGSDSFLTFSDYTLWFGPIYPPEPPEQERQYKHVVLRQLNTGKWLVAWSDPATEAGTLSITDRQFDTEEEARALADEQERKAEGGEA